jgi:hypothetical protein
MSSEQLRERMDRDRVAYLKTLGFESEQELKDFQKAEQERREKEEEERRAQQSREEQLQEDLQKAQQEREEAVEQAEALRWERHVSGICATVGVRNVEYAMFELERAANATPEGQEFDVEAWLRERIDPANAEQHGTMAAALGMEAPPVTPRAAPVTTTGDEPPPPAPPAGGGPPSDADAMNLTPEQWAARKEALGIS